MKLKRQRREKGQKQPETVRGVGIRELQDAHRRDDAPTRTSHNEMKGRKDPTIEQPENNQNERQKRVKLSSEQLTTSKTGAE